MKKVFTTIATAALFAVSFTSCNKCYECTSPDTEYTSMGQTTKIEGTTEEFCRKDADSRKDFNDGIDQLEEFGFTCDKK